MPPWTGFAAGDVFNSPCQISKTASSGSNAPVDRKTVTPKPESRLIWYVSVVFRVDLEIALRMIARRAHIRSLGAHDDVTAVAAFPDFYLALFEDLHGFHIGQQLAVAFLVMLFNGGNQAEFCGQLRESLFFRGLGKAVVHVGPLVIFALGGVQQVLGGIADALELLEPHLGMLFFIFGSLEEQG